MVNKQVTTSAQDRLELLESLSDDFRRRQASTSYWWLSSAHLSCYCMRLTQETYSRWHVIPNEDTLVQLLYVVNVNIKTVVKHKIVEF